MHEARLRLSDARLVFVFAAFLMVYLTIGARLAWYASVVPGESGSGGLRTHAASRPDILDRTGRVLATDITTASLFAEPRRIIDADEATELLTAVLPDLDAGDLYKKLSTDKGFVWLKREIPPRVEQAIHRLGLPGVGFRRESRRVYPFGRTVSHVLGAVNIDNKGIAGLEKYLDSTGLGTLQTFGFARKTAGLQPARLAMDIRVQFALRDELAAAMAKFKAKAASGLVMNVHTGEMLGMVSLPDYDPNDPAEALKPDRINRVSTGVFEMGSTFKAITTAMALDSGKVTLSSTFDASAPIRIGGFTISDYHGKNRVLTVPEVFIYSSNIGTAKMALAVGVEQHQAFLKRLGLLGRIRTELPESAMPLVPSPWTKLSTMTIGFGHGLSVSAMHMAAAGAALVNGGYLLTPTFFPRGVDRAREEGKRALKPETSEKMKDLLRLNALEGSASKANEKAAGYRIGGKTGTAEKVIKGRYVSGRLLTTFLGVFPMDAPKYLVFVTLDEPQGLPETFGYATSGWNASPTTGKVIARIAPFLGITPRFDLAESSAEREAEPR